jgi:hypothetical protein
MGKRSRKRSTGAAAARRPPAAAKPPAAPTGAAGAGGPGRHARPIARRARMDEAPPAPWSPFPLVELCILAGIILVIIAFATGGDSSIPLVVTGFALIAISAIELSIREHFAGFRSHTMLLAGATAVSPLLPLYIIAGPHQALMLVVAGLTFAVAFFVLRSAFARRAGGLGFRA